MSRSIAVVIAGGIALAVLSLSGVAFAQAQNMYGVVDMNRIEREYKGMQTLQETFTAFAQEQQLKISEKDRVMMLNDQDYQRYFDLKQAGAPTDANKQQMADLEKLSEQRKERRDELLATKDLTPEQKAELDELNKVFNPRMAELQKMSSEINALVNAKGEELLRQANDTVEAAVKAVAEQKKLSAVFLKAALLYGGTDITDDVIAKLNTPPVPTAPAK